MEGSVDSCWKPLWLLGLPKKTKQDNAESHKHQGERVRCCCRELLSAMIIWPSRYVLTVPYGWGKLKQPCKFSIWSCGHRTLIPNVCFWLKGICCVHFQLHLSVAGLHDSEFNRILFTGLLLTLNLRRPKMVFCTSNEFPNFETWHISVWCALCLQKSLGNWCEVSSLKNYILQKNGVWKSERCIWPFIWSINCSLKCH